MGGAPRGEAPSDLINIEKSQRAWAGVSAAVEAGIHTHAEKHTTELEALAKDCDMEWPVRTPQDIGGPGPETVGAATVCQGLEWCFAEEQGHPPAVGEVLWHSPQHQIPHPEHRHH